MSDEPDPTKREGPANKAWMSPTVGADSGVWAPSPNETAPRETIPPSHSISVFDPPEQRFVEKSELGRGGMGRVIEAIDRALGRSVAIKQSLATASVDLARFEREVRITAQLQHPSVIPILDVGRDPDGQPFYIMRKIEGDPLADRVMLAKTVGERLALVSSFLGAVDAAAYAHAKRIIHRDIKPWNILLGPFGETLLIDWGIARELDDEQDDPITLGAADTGVGLTQLGVAQGTPGFLAPEQARGEVVDARADVYSLGATLFYILANKLPYGRISATQAIDAAAEGKPPEFSVIPAEVPRELVAILTKSMAPDRADRYADAGELAADLRRFLAGKLVAAHEYKAREKLARWVRRHRIAVTVGTIALVTVAVVSTISIRQVIHDRDAAREATTLAEDRAEDLLIDRARLLASTDPTSSLATLRELPSESTRWPLARSIVRTALLAGVERRISRHTGYVRGLAFSPDGKWLVSSGEAIELHDLASLKTKHLAALAAARLRWRDDRTVVYLADGIAGTINIETGAIHQFTMRDAVQIETHGERVLVRTKAGAVIAVAGDRSEETLVATGAIDVDARDTRIAILGSTSITILDGIERKELALTESTDRGMIRLAPDRKRVATVTGSVVREWRLDSDAPPRQWTSLGEIGYAGPTLYGRNQRAFMSLEKELPTTRLTTEDAELSRIEAHIVPFEGGALLANDRSELAYVNGEGIRKFAHRSLGLNSVVVDRTGTRIALASDRDVLLMDLSSALPPSFPVPSTTELMAATLDHAVVRMTPFLDDPKEFVKGTSLIDVVTQRVTFLDPRMFQPFTNDNVIHGAPEVGRLHVWDSSGKRVIELDRVANYRVSDGAVVYVDLDGAIWRQPIGGQRVALGRLPISASLPNGSSAVRDMLLLDGEPVFNVFDKTSTRLFLASGAELVLGVPGFAPNVFGRDSKGAWYAIDHLTGTLWRSLHGVAKPVSVDHVPGHLQILPDRLLVSNKDSTMTELDLEGRVIRTFSLIGAHPRMFGEDYVVVTTLGVDLIGRTGARGTIRIPGDVRSVHANGKHIVALAVGDRGSRLYVWTDRVPEDPKTLRGYLDTLTNARLPTGSDALSWD